MLEDNEASNYIVCQQHGYNGYILARNIIIPSPKFCVVKESYINTVFDRTILDRLYEFDTANHNFWMGIMSFWQSFKASRVHWFGIIL